MRFLLRLPSPSNDSLGNSAQPVTQLLRIGPPSCSTVPDLRTGNFVARQDALDAIARVFDSAEPDDISSVAIWGTRGVGKSQLALQHAHVRSPKGKHQKRYQYVFWIRANSSDAILSGYRDIAHLVALADHSIGPEEDGLLVTHVKKWLLHQENWLLVFDNVRETSLIRQFTPVEGSGNIIFTTNNQTVAETLASSVATMKLLPFDLHSGVDLIFSICRFSRQSHDWEIPWAEKLSDLLAGLPLALDQIARLSLADGINLRTAHERLTHNMDLLQHAHPGAIHEDGLGTAALLQQTLRRVSTDNLSAPHLFRFLVWLDVSSIPVSIFAASGRGLEAHLSRTTSYDLGVILGPNDEQKVLRLDSEEPAQRVWPGVPANDRADNNKTADKQKFSISASKREIIRERLLRPMTPLRWSDSGRKSKQTVHSNSLPALPRVDSKTDINFNAYITSSEADGLRHVLLDHSAGEIAISALCNRGLVQRITQDTLWIHDLWAQLMLDFIAREDAARAQTGAGGQRHSRDATAKPTQSEQHSIQHSIPHFPSKVCMLHLAMTLIYLVMDPIAYRSFIDVGRGSISHSLDEKMKCEVLLPSAIRVLEAAQQVEISSLIIMKEQAQADNPGVSDANRTLLLTDATIGPELCRVVGNMVQSARYTFKDGTFHLEGSARKALQREDRSRAIYWLKQSVAGYEVAVRRLRKQFADERIREVVRAEQKARVLLQHDFRHNEWATVNLMSETVMYGCAVTRLRDAMVTIGHILMPMDRQQLETVEPRTPEELEEGMDWLQRAAEWSKTWFGEWSQEYYDALWPLVRGLDMLGEYEGMRATTSRCIEIFEAIGAADLRKSLAGKGLLTEMGKACLGLGRWQEAMDWFEEAIECCQKLYREKEPRELCDVWRLMAQVGIARGRLDEARRSAGTALVVFWEYHMKFKDMSGGATGLDTWGVPWELDVQVLEDLDCYERIERMIEQERGGDKVPRCVGVDEAESRNFGAASRER